MNLNKSHFQSFVFQNCYLHLRLNSSWEEYVDEDGKNYGVPLTFYKKDNGVGALQISILTSSGDQEFNITDILKRNNQGHIKKIDEYDLNGFRVYEYEDVQNDRYTKFFHLIRSKAYVFATYNCDIKKKNDMEMNEALEIVRSIEVEMIE